MDALLDAPSFVIVALTLASALLLIEIVLPTLGLAGSGGLALAVASVFAVQRQEVEWWPLVLIGLAVCVWAVLLVRRTAPQAWQVLAALLYAAGGMGYAASASDPVAVAIAAVAAVVLALDYPFILRAATRLLDQPSHVGMESFVGKTAIVERADGKTGAVRIGGSLWNASVESGALPAAGEQVIVTGFEGMMLHVAPATVRS